MIHNHVSKLKGYKLTLLGECTMLPLFSLKIFFLYLLTLIQTVHGRNKYVTKIKSPVLLNKYGCNYIIEPCNLHTQKQSNPAFCGIINLPIVYPLQCMKDATKIYLYSTLTRE